MAWALIYEHENSVIRVIQSLSECKQNHATMLHSSKSACPAIFSIITLVDIEYITSCQNSFHLSIPNLGSQVLIFPPTCDQKKHIQTNPLEQFWTCWWTKFHVDESLFVYHWVWPSMWSYCLHFSPSHCTESRKSSAAATWFFSKHQEWSGICVK